MQIKFIDIGQIRLAYLEKHPELKQTIFFIHGNSSSSRMWLKQLNDPLFDGYRLIAFDLPGHGESVSPLNEEDCDCINFGKIVANAIDKLANNDKIILVGYSMGANMIAETLNCDCFPKGIGLVGSSVIGGDYTMQVVFKSEPGSEILFMDTVSPEKMSQCIKLIYEIEDEKEYKIWTEDYKKTKPFFRPAILKNTLDGKISNEMKLLEESKIPILAIFGEEDKIIDPDYLDKAPLNFWNKKVYKIPHASHAVNIDQPEIFNELLVSFTKALQESPVNSVVQ